MIKHYLKYQFLEHGMFFKEGGGVSDIQTLASTKGISGSKQLLGAFDDNKPTDSSFYEKEGAVSCAFIQTELGYAFVQIQRRQEFKAKTTKTNKTSGLFDQIRFTLLDIQDYKNALAEGCNLFQSLIINTDGRYSLEIYKQSLGMVNVPNLEYSIPSGDYIRMITSSKILNAIKIIGEALQTENQVVVIYDNGEFSLFERLVIVQEIERILLPTLDKPITFTLDYIFHPRSKIGIRFQASDEPYNAKSFVVNLEKQISNRYIENVTNFLYSNVSKWDSADKTLWVEAHARLYQDKVANFLAQQGKNQEAAKWLNGILLSESDLLSYFATLFEFNTKTAKALYKPYFDRKYKDVINDEQTFKSFMLDSNYAFRFLSIIKEYGYDELDFKIKEWAEIVIYANLTKEEKLALLDSFKGKHISIDDAADLLKWATNKKSQVFYDSNSIVYNFFLEKLLKNHSSAIFILTNLAHLIDGDAEKEIKHWCKHLSIPKSGSSIWSWVKSTFNNFRSEIYAAILEINTDNKQLNINQLSKDDLDAIISLQDTSPFKNSRSIKSLLDIIKQNSKGNSNETKNTQTRTSHQDKIIDTKTTSDTEEVTMEFNDDEDEKRVEGPHPSYKIERVSQANAHKKLDGNLINSNNRIPRTKPRLKSFKESIKTLAALVIFFGLLYISAIFFQWLSSPNSFNLPSKTPSPANVSETNTPSQEPLLPEISTEMWSLGQGDLYLTLQSSLGLFFLDPITQELMPRLNGCIQDVFINSSEYLFYTTCDNPNAISVNFLNFNNQAVPLIQEEFLLEKPSIYPRDSTKKYDKNYDASFICKKQSICLLFRPEDGLKGLAEFDEYGINWNGNGIDISSTTWIDDNNMLLSFSNPNDPSNLFIFSLSTASLINKNEWPVKNWETINTSEPFIDMERWVGSTSDNIYLALLGKEENNYIIYVVQLRKMQIGEFEKTEFQKYLIHNEITNINQIRWDPQKNKIAFIGDMGGDQICKECLFLLDLGTRNTSLINFPGGIKSIFWTSKNIEWSSSK